MDTKLVYLGVFQVYVFSLYCERRGAGMRPRPGQEIYTEYVKTWLRSKHNAYAPTLVVFRL
jgi:hypothetical protein